MEENTGETKRPGWGRRKLLINKRFQLTMIGFNAALAILAIVVVFIQNQYLFSKFTGTESPEFQVDPIIVEMVEEERFRMNLVFGVTALVVLGTLVVGGLILSNRVAGPLHRLDRHMKKIAEDGQASPVKFREKDYFQDLAGTFNRMMDRLKGG